LIAVEFAGISKEELLHQIETIQTEIKTADELFRSHMYSPPPKYAEAAKQIESYSIQAQFASADKLLDIHLIVNALTAGLQALITQSKTFLEERDALVKRATALNDQAEAAAKLLQEQNKTQEAQVVRFNLAVLAGDLSKIRNAKSPEEMKKLEEGYAELEAHIMKLIQA